MTKHPPAQPPLTLFDASLFDATLFGFEADPDAKAPARPPPPTSHGGRFAASVAVKRIASSAELARVRPAHRPAVLLPDRGIASSAELARVRRRRARARLAKRRYLADREGYERLEQARRGLHLVTD